MIFLKEINAYDFLGMYKKYQVIVFVKVQLIKIIFFKDEQTRSTQICSKSLFLAKIPSFLKGLISLF